MRANEAARSGNRILNYKRVEVIVVAVAVVAPSEFDKLLHSRNLARPWSLAGVRSWRAAPFNPSFIV
jgi:hypothetical protein